MAHILLTITHVISFIPDNRGQISTHIGLVPKPLRCAVPIGQLGVNKAGDSDCGEISYVFDRSTSYRTAEHFEDILNALEMAGVGFGEHGLIRVPLREVVEKAVAQAFPMPEKVANMPGGPKWSDLRRSMAAAKAGDFRIVEDGMGGYWIERFTVGTDHTTEWLRDFVPPELRASFKSKEAAIEAIRIAGFIRLLVDDETQDS
jgi:hypothetical protein